MNIINTNLNFKQMDTRSSTKRIILHHAAAKSVLLKIFTGGI